MNTHSDRPEISIRTPCPKRWEELSGDDRRRFCSECSLHVHNAAELTRQEARALVAQAEGRVCMRVEYDPQGAPIHRETRVQRLARWALASGAALLAACHGGREPAPAAQPAEPPSRMGKVVAQEMGDVALPQVHPPERLGEAVSAPDPAQPKPK